MKKIKLGELLKKLNQIDCINSGGCGIAAIAIYKFLEKNNLLNKKTQILYTYNLWHNSIYKNNLKNKANNKVLDAPTHVVIKYRKKYIDSNGIKIKLYPKKLYHEVTLEDLIKCIKNPFKWNMEFDRTIEIPKIEKIFNISLKEIKNK